MLNLTQKTFSAARGLLAISFLATTGICQAADLKKTEIDAALNQAYTKYKGLQEGKNADYIPALAKVPSQYYGIALVTVDGQVHQIGDTDKLFSIQSISKVFTMAQVLQESGEDLIEKG